MGSKNSILFTLSDGKPHDRARLCDQWGISQGELDKTVGQLHKDGLKLENSINGNVRWKNPSELLNEEKIRQGLTPACESLISSFMLYYSLSSTNQTLREHASKSGVVCLAEKQTQGRGRKGRSWVSPPAQNIYLSIHWKFQQPLQHAGLLSIAAGIAVTRALNELGYNEVGLKWPNDLVLQGQKLGGILVDVISHASHGMRVIIGIGLNVAMKTSEQAIDQPWTSLTANNPDAAKTRNICVAAILNELFEMLDQFTDHGSSYVQKFWSGFDQTAGRVVRVISNEKKFTGLGAGIDDQGRFQLQTDAGLMVFHDADVSLRLQ